MNPHAIKKAARRGERWNGHSPAATAFLSLQTPDDQAQLLKNPGLLQSLAQRFDQSERARMMQRHAELNALLGSAVAATIALIYVETIPPYLTRELDTLLNQTLLQRGLSAGHIGGASAFSLERIGEAFGFDHGPLERLLNQWGVLGNPTDIRRPH